MLRLASRDGESVRAPLNKSQAVALASRVRAGLSLAAQVLLGYLASRCSPPDADGIMRRSKPLPRQWLAERLGRSGRTASRATAELIGLGLVSRTFTGREAFYEVDLEVAERLVAQDLRGPEGHPCHLRGDIDVTPSFFPLKGEELTGLASSAAEGRGEPDAFGGEPGAEEPAPMPTAPSGLRAALRSYSAPERPRREKETPPPGDHKLARFYVALVASMSPGYELAPGQIRRVDAAEAKLRKSGLPEDRWEGYLRGLFDWWREAGRGAWPPASALGGDAAIDRALSEAALPGRSLDRLDLRALYRLLRAEVPALAKPFSVEAIVELARERLTGAPRDPTILIPGEWEGRISPRHVAGSDWLVANIHRVPLLPREPRRRGEEGGGE